MARNEGETIAGTGADAREGAGGRELAGQDDQQTTSSNQNGGAAMGVSGTAGRIAKFISADEIGSSRMTETASGNVGIGTTTPAAKLEVASNWTGEVGALQVSGDKPTAPAG